MKLSSNVTQVVLRCTMHHGQGNKVSSCFPLKYEVVVALLFPLEKPNLVSGAGSEKQTNKQTNKPHAQKTANATWENLRTATPFRHSKAHLPSNTKHMADSKHPKLTLTDDKAASVRIWRRKFNAWRLL